MSVENGDPKKWLYLLLAALAAVVLFRFLMVFRFLFVVLLIVSLAIFVPYLLWRLWQNRQLKRSYQSSTEGQIRERQRYCTEQINKIEEEKEEILSSIQNLEKQLKEVDDIIVTNREETKDLIKRFYSELELRKAKLAFFETCRFKLEKLLHNHLLTNELDTQKEKLRQLQEDHYEDLAKMEELKTEVEHEVLYLETIEELSKKIEKSKTLDHTESLRLELEEMLRELKGD